MAWSVIKKFRPEDLPKRLLPQGASLVDMADLCDYPERVWVEIGPVPGRFPFTRALDRVYHAPKPLRFVSHLPELCDTGFEYVLAERFPIEVEALRVFNSRDGAIPDLVQAFNPPLLLADGDLLEPTIPAGLPAPCRAGPNERP